jgi:hypothetical protein
MTPIALISLLALAVPVDPPALPGAMAPSLSSVGGDVALTWLEPASADEKRRSRLRFARFADGAWSEPVTIVEHDDFFANWADVPWMAQAGDDALVATWPQKTADDTYAYDVMVARSEDGGVSWRVLGPANDDKTPTEHGFVSLVPEGDNVRVFWLDGRAMAGGPGGHADDGHGGGDMMLRTAVIGTSIGPSVVLDPRVCECCATAAVATSTGPLIVYRDRSPDEVRDISIVRRVQSDWTQPRTVHADNWLIAGCPVNGPAIDARGGTVVLGWYTGAENNGVVRASISTDNGASFAPPVTIDDTWPIGRVDVLVLPSGDAIVSWLDSGTLNGAVMLRRVTADGILGAPLRVAEAGVGHATGFPMIAQIESDLIVVWTDNDDTTHIRAITVPIESVISL